MQNILRWTGFTIATALAAMAIVFSLHILARHYGGLGSPAVMFASLIFFSFFTSIAAIAYASKLDDEAEKVRARRLNRREKRNRAS